MIQPAAPRGPSKRCSGLLIVAGERPCRRRLSVSSLIRRTPSGRRPPLASTSPHTWQPQHVPRILRRPRTSYHQRDLCERSPPTSVIARYVITPEGRFMRLLWRDDHVPGRVVPVQMDRRTARQSRTSASSLVSPTRAVRASCQNPERRRRCPSFRQPEPRRRGFRWLTG